MARLYYAGAESGHIHAEGMTNVGTGANTIITATKRTGTRAFQHDGTAANGAPSLRLPFTTALGIRYFTSVWIYIPSSAGMPAVSNLQILRFRSTPNLVAAAALHSTGKIRLLDSAGTQVGSDSAATITTDTWYKLSLACEVGTGSVDFAEVQLDDVSVASTSGAALSETAITDVAFGPFSNIGINKILITDDFVLNDNVGSAHNTWPGNDKIVLLLPTADAARDAGWLNGAAGTTNLFEAVNNIPPAGVAVTSSTATSQIENAVSTTTEEYDATMTTYSAAGIASGDTISAIFPVTEGCSSSTTGTDTIGIEVESNPVIFELAASVDANAGTYPTSWIRGQGAISENPTVTLGTAPVMSLRKNVATTRIHTCCFMGMYVSYIPGSPPASSGRGPQVITIMG